MDLEDPRFIPDFWERYREISEIYWSDRALAKQLEYERFQRELQWIRKHRMQWWRECHGLCGMFLTLLLLPLIIADEVYWDQQYAEAVAYLEDFKWEQALRDENFKTLKSSLRDALRNYDIQEGTKLLHCMDELVTQMAAYAADVVNASEKYKIPPVKGPRFATIEQVYAKLYEPAFREFQSKQRPCRRFEGTYLEYIRKGQYAEITKKNLNRNSRNRKMAEAFEIVFGIGDKDNTGYEKAFVDAKQSETLLKDFCDHLLEQKNICFVTTKELGRPDWRPPFNNGLIVVNLNVHCDEATPGVHMTCIPYTRNCKRGPTVQPALGRVLSGMGYPSTWKNALDENGNPIPKRNRNGEIVYNKDGSIRYKQEPDGKGILDFIEEQKQWIQAEMRERFGWEREYKGAHPRGNLSTPDYKVAKAEERKQMIEHQIDMLIAKAVEEIEKQIDRLDESVEKVWRDASDWEMIAKYLNTCTDEEYEMMLKRATSHLDRLPVVEREKAKQTLSQMIQQAQQKAGGGIQTGEICEKGKW